MVDSTSMDSLAMDRADITNLPPNNGHNNLKAITMALLLVLLMEVITVRLMVHLKVPLRDIINILASSMGNKAGTVLQADHPAVLTAVLSHISKGLTATQCLRILPQPA